MSREDVKHQIISHIMAGHVTTGVGLSWLFYHLGKRPELANQLKEQFNEFSQQNINENRLIMNHELLDAVVSENYRMRTPKFFLSRYVKEETVIETSDGTLKIPANTDIILSAHQAHKDKVYWGLEKTGFPHNEFHPARWSRDNMEKHQLTKKDLISFPFSGGSRFCPGRAIGLTITKYFVYEFVKQFDFQLVDSSPVGMSSQISQHPRHGPFIQITN